MAKMTLSSPGIDASFIKEAKTDIDNKSSSIEEVVNDIIKVYAFDLDNLVLAISQDINKNELDSLTDQQLESYCLRLSALMYFVGAGQELIGLREDIANAIYKENYNSQYSIAEGTIADKKASAELDTQDDALVNMVYNHAQKIMQSKLDYAVHLLTSIRRVLSRRIEQMKMNPVNIKYSTEG